MKSKDRLRLDYAILSVTAEELHAPTVFPLLSLFFPLLCFIYTKFINSTRKLNLARSPEETKLSRVERMRLWLGKEGHAGQKGELGRLSSSVLLFCLSFCKRTFPA